ncbi:ABC transporter permease [Geminocystis sp. CENA526]|uniref:ABC transporter permease n=1 Tax=Geminocystis sp. CENA526 TaxID=1355871 RepID=UPI003D700C26
MKIVDLFSLTFTSLRNNPLRSFLSSLGVFMGVFAISGTLQVSDIGKTYLRKQLEEMESPRIFISSPRNPIIDKQVKYEQEDLKWLRNNLAGWGYIIPFENAGNGEINYQNKKINIQAQAVVPDFLSASGRKIISGSFFTQTDYQKNYPVIVIDEVVANSLFQDENVLGKMLYFQNKSYYIKGIIEAKQSDIGIEKQGLIFIPLSLHQSSISSPFFEQIIITPSHHKDLEKLQNQALNLLKQRFKNHDISAYSNIDSVKMFEETLIVVTIILLLVGGIALVVGGVGIANITIASVVERTSEIGLRKAIGATETDILSQFLLESTIISLTGGIMAIGIIQVTTILVVNIFTLPYEFNYQTPLISLGSAVFVGISSSFLSAKRASELDPVIALKS